MEKYRLRRDLEEDASIPFWVKALLQRLETVDPVDAVNWLRVVADAQEVRAAIALESALEEKLA